MSSIKDMSDEYDRLFGNDKMIGDKQKRIDDSLAKQLERSIKRNSELEANRSVFEKEVWNAAIEKAAKQADGAYGGLADEIRKLKV